MSDSATVQKLDAIVKPDTGGTYRVYVHAEPRPEGTWQAFLEFRPDSGGESLMTTVETTQPSLETTLYWASGLNVSFLEGSFVRAFRRHRQDRPEIPVVQNAGAVPPDPAARAARLRDVERHILDSFRLAGTTRIRTDSLFNRGIYTNSDLVRGFEDLEKQWKYVVRRTEEGSDWLDLTDEGAKLL